MKVIVRCVTFLFSVFCTSSLLLAQDPAARGLTKIEYYNNILAPRYGLKLLSKTSGEADRKLSTLNVGNVWAKISNAATLGYDRWGTCWEFPARSGITYRWTMAPMIGALKKDSAGNYQKRVAIGTRGAARKSEEEFQPLPGYDSGTNDEVRNIGIAFSDVKASWPASWPTLADLRNPNTLNVPYAAKVDYPLPKIDSAFGFPGVSDGKVSAPREVYFAVTDNDPKSGNLPLPLDVRVDVWGLQYDDQLNKNFIIFRLQFTNVGTDTLKNVYIGIHDDPDAPEQGAAEWTDDYAAFIQSGTTGIPGYTPYEDTLLWNFTYLWDGDDKVEGLIAKNVGWVGLKFLETPQNPLTNKPTGVTSLQVFEYSAVPQGDDKEYDQMAAGIMAPQNVTPNPKDYTQTPNSYGPDITYVVASGPFTLAPGKSLPFAFASIHGSNKKDLFNSAILCQLLYNANFNSAEPPPEPIVTAVGGNKNVTLYWDDNAETGRYRKSDGTIDHVFDRLTHTNAFEGYRIYKSSDRGITWGNPIIDFQGVNRGTIPLAQYDLKNNITGESTHPLGRYFYLGEDTGLRHTFVDNNVNNGYEYWYAVCAYDRDDGVIPPLQNSIKADPNKNGDNTVAVTPLAPPKGTTAASVSSGAQRISGRATISSIPISIVNPSIVPEDSFQISFNVISSLNKSFSIKNIRTGSYVRTIAGDTVKNWPFYNSLSDNKPIFNGLTLSVRDTINGVAKAQQVSPANATNLKFKSVKFYNVNNKGAEDDYAIEFTDSSQMFWTALSGGGNNHKQIFKVPLKVTNLSTNTPSIFVIDKAGAIAKSYIMQKGDHILIMDAPYKAGIFANDSTVTIDTTAAFSTRGVKPDISKYALQIQFDTVSTFAKGDVYTIETIKTFSNADMYTFIPVATTERSIKEEDLSGITVVPNPFIVSSPYETGKYGLQKQIQFQRLPNRCTIRIYNIAGDLVRTLEHDGGSVETWNLQTYNGQEVSFGIYIFHVDAPGIGKHINKFAIIK